jgi:hypothetical protein
VRRTGAFAVAVAFAVLAVAGASAQDFAFVAKVADAGHPVQAGLTNLGVTGALNSLVVLNRSPSGIDVFPRSGTGFGSPTFTAFDVAVGEPSSFTEFRDSATGLQDVAVLAANGLIIGVSDGKGGLTLHVIPLTGADGGDIVSGDFNHDGLPDIAFTEPLGHDVGIALNAGGNSFPSPRGIAVAQLNDGGLAVGNFNRDSTLDIAVATTTGISILNGVGDGTFALPISINLNAAPTALASADVDLDGLTDLAVGEANGIEVLDDKTQPGGLEVFSGVFLVMGTSPVGVVMGDVNGDNRLDVIGLNRGSGNVSTFLATTAGQSYGPIDNVPVGANPLSVSLGRFDDDGFADLAVVNDSGVGVYRGTGSVEVLTGTPLPFVSTPHGPGTGHKRTPNEQISPPKSQLSVGATISGSYFWDVNVPVAKKPLACGLFDAKTNRQIKNPLFAGVKQKQTCTATHKTRIVHGDKKQIVHVQLDLTTTNAKGSATVWIEVFWK